MRGSLSRERGRAPPLKRPKGIRLRAAGQSLVLPDYSYHSLRESPRGCPPASGRVKVRPLPSVEVVLSSFHRSCIQMPLCHLKPTGDCGTSSLVSGKPPWDRFAFLREQSFRAPRCTEEIAVSPEEGEGLRHARRFILSWPTVPRSDTTRSYPGHLSVSRGPDTAPEWPFSCQSSSSSDTRHDA
jgi:hypothetical protein